MNFTKNYIEEKKESIADTATNYKQFSDYDVFVIGSDQTWNYNFSRFSSLDFVPYANASQKVISYAASFGVYSIPDRLFSTYKKGLDSIDCISVREEAGKKIVESITDKTAKVVLDPTLLLSKDDWNTLANNSKLNIPQKYVLTYFLGELNSKDKNYILNYANNHGCTLVSLGDRESEYWSAGPEDFVKLFQNSEAVFTDSFHACVFSIIFEKYFEVFQRNSKIPSMNSRLDTLFNDLGLDDRWHLDGKVKAPINYKKVMEKLSHRKKDSLEFLESSILDNKKE